jgi:2-polyprenyl-3-methyl-5-hydroxy-6-metoxy-1,4-benzoquinol methylase
VRWRTCPFAAVAAHVPLAGDVLDVGCGHGLFSTYLALGSPARSVVGSDIDSDKIEAARNIAERDASLAGRLRFQVDPPGEVPRGPWDAITIVDVLYLLDDEQRTGLLSSCAARLTGSGRLVMKEVDVRPRWKHAWTVAQETVSVKLAKITEGGRVSFTPPDQLTAEMESAGLRVRRHRVDRGYPYPHLVLVGERG